MKTIVVIPIYHKEPDEVECYSLKQVFKVLNKHQIAFVCSESLDVSPYIGLINKSVPIFRADNAYFFNTNTYSKLCESAFFYEWFKEYDYMLLYQLDAWVFEDTLDKFCGMGYDYIGAPHWYNGEICVGNGGLSLRKISKFIEVCKTTNFAGLYWAEDVAFSYDLKEKINVAPIEVARNFSLNRYGFAGYVRNGNKLPFGCHGVRRWDWEEFWAGKIKFNPLVSVIIPCYNAARFVAEAIRSVKGQSYQNWECVIVDDGSKDNSVTEVEKEISGDSRFKLIRQKNKGCGAARNTAIRASYGKYVFPLDADDIYDPDYLKNAVNYLEANPKCAVYYGKIIRFGDGIEDREFRPAYCGYESLLRKNSIFAAAAFRRADFDRVGGYNEELHGYEDWEFWIRLLYKNDIVFKSDMLIYWYRYTPGSLVSEADAHKQELTARIHELNKEIYDLYR